VPAGNPAVRDRAATEIRAVARKFPKLAASVRLIHRQKTRKISRPPAGISLAVGLLEREGFP